MRPSVVVVGGGYGGIAVAKALDADTDVILVEPKDAFVHSVASLRAVVRDDWISRIFIPYDRLLSRGRVVPERAVRVQPGEVTLASGAQITADFVVLATGSTYPFPAKADVDDSEQAKEKYRSARAELVRAGRVLLLGAGPVGLELAGEILAEWPHKRVVIVDPAEEILREHSGALRHEIRAQLEALDVRLILGSPLVAKPPTAPGIVGCFTVETEDKVAITADLWLRCHGARPVTEYLAGDLAKARQPNGLVEVTPELRVVGQSAVFAIGDITSIAESKRAGAAGRHATVVAANIRSLASGVPTLSVYSPGPSAIVIPLGPTGGASEAPTLGVVGAEETSRLKGDDLMIGRFLKLLSYEPGVS
jgi:apoptosis-inducing factor 2